jgi:hypothetical protein
MSRHTQGFIKPPTQWTSHFISPTGKRPERETNSLSSSRASFPALGAPSLRAVYAQKQQIFSYFLYMSAHTGFYFNSPKFIFVYLSYPFIS